MDPHSLIFFLKKKKISLIRLSKHAYISLCLKEQWSADIFYMKYVQDKPCEQHEPGKLRIHRSHERFWIYFFFTCDEGILAKRNSRISNSSK
jgi:hypothetical protein